MNFGTLKSRILGIIGRAPSEVCYELVTADINQQMRLMVMQSSTTLTAAASITLPTDFLGAVDAYLDTDPRTPLRATTAGALNRTSQSSGTTREYAIVDGAMLINPVGSDDIELRYYASLADLSADADVNNVLTTYPSIYVYGVLAHHAALIRDTEAVATWFAAYEKAKGQARAADTKQRMGGLPVVPVVRTAP